MLGGHRRRFEGFAGVVAAPFVWLHVPPTAVTLLALVPGLVGTYLVSQRLWFAGVAVGLVASLLDFADGAVARRTGRVTLFGGFLDSVLDRVVDLAFLFGLGIAIGTDEGWFLVAVGTMGSYGTSYARARLFEAMPDPKVRWNQLMERPERLLVLASGVVLQGVAESLGASWATIAGRPIVFWALALMTLGAVVTMVQRIWLARTVLGQRGPPSGPAARAP